MADESKRDAANAVKFTTVFGNLLRETQIEGLLPKVKIDQSNLVELFNGAPRSSFQKMWFRGFFITKKHFDAAKGFVSTHLDLAPYETIAGDNAIRPNAFIRKYYAVACIYLAAQYESAHKDMIPTTLSATIMIGPEGSKRATLCAWATHPSLVYVLAKPEVKAETSLNAIVIKGAFCTTDLPMVAEDVKAGEVAAAAVCGLFYENLQKLRAARRSFDAKKGGAMPPQISNILIMAFIVQKFNLMGESVTLHRGEAKHTVGVADIMKAISAPEEGNLDLVATYKTLSYAPM